MASGTGPAVRAALPAGPARSGLVAVALMAVAAAAWWLTLSAPMPAALPAFLGGWVAMMVAMMLPSQLPVVSLYRRAAQRRTVAPVSVFLLGYLAVWAGAGLPAYLLWRPLQPAVMQGRVWTGQLAGAALLAAATYQLTPLKGLCLRGCRSPLTAFTALRGSLADPWVAVRAGARNGLWCLGCCWALMAVLVTVGVMRPWWMVGISAVIFTEKASRWGPRTTVPFALLLALLGLLVVTHPQLLSSPTITRKDMS